MDKSRLVEVGISLLTIVFSVSAVWVSLESKVSKLEQADKYKTQAIRDLKSDIESYENISIALATLIEKTEEVESKLSHIEDLPSDVARLEEKLKWLCRDKEESPQK